MKGGGRRRLASTLTETVFQTECSIRMEESLSPTQRDQVLGLYVEGLLTELRRMVEESADWTGLDLVVSTAMPTLVKG